MIAAAPMRRAPSREPPKLPRPTPPITAAPPMPKPPRPKPPTPLKPVMPPPALNRPIAVIRDQGAPVESENEGKPKKGGRPTKPKRDAAGPKLFKGRFIGGGGIPPGRELGRVRVVV